MQWRAVLVAALFLASAPAAQAQPRLPPPTGEEREKIVEGIRASYPAMPARLVETLADSRREMGSNSPCDLIDWMAANGPEQMRAQIHANFVACALPTDELDAKAVEARLAGKAFGVDVTGDVLTVLARSETERLDLCCTLKAPMTRVGASGFWAARWRLAKPDVSVMSLRASAPAVTGETLVWRGPAAPPLPARKAEGTLTGQVLSRTIDSDALGERRKLSIYLPPGWSEARTWPALFLADGMAKGYAPLVEAMIDAGRIPPIVLVSAQTGPDAIEGPPAQHILDVRAAEYVRGAPVLSDDKRFAAHMDFFARELTAYAVDEFRVAQAREQRAVAGFSNGGDFALWAGLQHPEMFGAAVAMSPGVASVTPDDLEAEPRARFIVSGGDYEPGFQHTARAVEQALRDNGHEASGHYTATGHDSIQWDIVLHDALIALFGAR